MFVPKLVKPSISNAVREIIDADLSFQDALHRGYANISAIARIIKPRVEEIVGRKVNVESIITSLKRLKIEYKQTNPSIRSVIARSTINVRTDVVKISVEKTKRTLEVVRSVLASYQEEFLQVSESISAITLIFDQKLLDKVKSAFKSEDILEEASNLAAIIVHSPKDIIKTPGCAIAFYNQVSRRRINIEDTVSCYTDTIIVVKMDDVSKAFTALTELISASRRSV
ncbi:MAG: hypothetical protein NZ896_03125 [Nitrososphaerales archaeon]|nr:hypothetical protein [Nitrososphaerales archaeon]